METRIREIRAERGWTVRRLAEESGVDKNTISEAERGKRKPNPITMHKLAQALEVEVRDLFPLEKTPLPLPDFEDERRELTTADELLEVRELFRRQARQYAQGGRRAVASEVVPQTYFAGHYNAAVEKLARLLPAELVGPFADVLEGYAEQELRIAEQELRIAQLEKQLRRATDGTIERTAKPA